MTSRRAESDAVPEPLYSREVFERLRETLAWRFTGDAVIADKDKFIEPNYEIRDDGAWLRSDGVLDALEWTPVCDLEEGPESPDPLTSPALPFPFTAQELAAFMLDGWGWFLHSHFAGEEGQLDAGIVQTLLSGVRAVKPRAAIAAAFAALTDARQHVGEPSGILAEELRSAEALFSRSTDVAERLNNWRERGIGDEERSARVQRRNKMTAPASKSLDQARSAQREDYKAWRKAMVRVLLTRVPVTQRTVDVVVTPSQRQETRYQACVDAGLQMPIDDYRHLPRGIGKVAQTLGITRQALAQDVRAHIRRLKE